MNLTSPDFKDNEFIPREFSCDGDNTNPALNISDIPAQTKSLALTLTDPDAPRGEFTHWLLWNIDPGINFIGKGKIPIGAGEGINDSGKKGYLGPCPPSGTHHYIFNLYALKDTLPFSTLNYKSELINGIKPILIDKCELVGLYSKN